MQYGRLRGMGNDMKKKRSVDLGTILFYCATH
jgi:hypothetical protein